MAFGLLALRGLGPAYHWEIRRPVYLGVSFWNSCGGGFHGKPKKTPLPFWGARFPPPPFETSRRLGLIDPIVLSPGSWRSPRPTIRQLEDVPSDGSDGFGAFTLGEFLWVRRCLKWEPKRAVSFWEALVE